jgi:hypothetical protein
MNKSSAVVCADHLKPFESFATDSYGIDLDSLIINMRDGKYNSYSILSEFNGTYRILITINHYQLLLYEIE